MPGLKKIHHVFFADDAILVSDTITSGLQNKLNLIKMRSERLGLEVNLDKTQIKEGRPP